MTLNTIKNVTMISTENLDKVSGGLFPLLIGLPDIFTPGTMGEPIYKEDKDERKDGGATGGW